MCYTAVLWIRNDPFSFLIWRRQERSMRENTGCKKGTKWSYGKMWAKLREVEINPKVLALMLTLNIKFYQVWFVLNRFISNLGFTLWYAISVQRHGFIPSLTRRLSLNLFQVNKRMYRVILGVTVWGLIVELVFLPGI